MKSSGRLKVLVAAMAVWVLVLGLSLGAEAAQLSDDELVANALNNTYTIPDFFEQGVTLTDGRFVNPAPRGPRRVYVPEHFQPVVGYFRVGGQNVPGTATPLKVYGGGTGFFNFVVATVRNEAGQMVGTNAISLGDRIRVQNLRFENGKIIVDYLAHAVNQGLGSAPTLAKTKVLIIRDWKLVEEIAE